MQMVTIVVAVLLVFASSTAALPLQGDADALTSNYAQNLPLNAPEYNEPAGSAAPSEEEEPFVSAPVPDMSEMPRFAETPHIEIQPKLRPRHSTLLPPPLPSRARKSFESSQSASMPPALRPSPPLKKQEARRASSLPIQPEQRRVVATADESKVAARDESENSNTLDEPESRGQVAPEEQQGGSAVNEPVESDTASPSAESRGASVQESVLDLDSLPDNDSEQNAENEQEEQNSDSDSNSDDTEQASDDSEQDSDSEANSDSDSNENETENENDNDSENADDEENSDPRPDLQPPRWSDMADI